MSWDSEFESLMPDTVTIEACTAVNSYGARTFAAAKTVRCRDRKSVV